MHKLKRRKAAIILAGAVTLGGLGIAPGVADAKAIAPCAGRAFLGYNGRSPICGSSGGGQFGPGRYIGLRGGPIR